jgi:hypothetical protein
MLETPARFNGLRWMRQTVTRLHAVFAAIAAAVPHAPTIFFGVRVLRHNEHARAPAHKAYRLTFWLDGFSLTGGGNCVALRYNDIGCACEEGAKVSSAEPNASAFAVHETRTTFAAARHLTTGLHSSHNSGTSHKSSGRCRGCANKGLKQKTPAVR